MAALSGRIRRLPVSVPLLALTVVMPLMAVAAAGLAAVTVGVGAAAALLLGTALCPTDPVLASSVVTGEPAERDIAGRSRQLLSLESGANDGLALPLVLVAVAVAGDDSVGGALLESAWQVVVGLTVGVCAGWLAGRALRAGERHGTTEGAAALFFTLLLALGVLGLDPAVLAAGSLVIAASVVAHGLTGSPGRALYARTAPA